MKIRIIQVSAATTLIASALLAGGCKTTAKTGEQAKPAVVVQTQMVDDKRIIVNPSLASRMHVVAVNEVRTPGDLLKVQLQVVSLITTRQRFTYHVQWFDAAGMQISSTTGAILPCVLEAKEVRYLSTVAPHPACKEFRVQFMESSN